MIRILLSDKSPLTRMGINAALCREKGLTVVGEVDNDKDIEGLCNRLTPNILLLHLGSTERSLLTRINNILSHFPHLKVLVITTCCDEVFIRKMIDSGISGFLIDDVDPDTLIRAIHAVMNGDLWCCRQIIDILAKPDSSSGFLEGGDVLTRRECEILSLLASGLTNYQIAQTLMIAAGTVKNHIVNINHKLGLHSRAVAVAWAWQHKIIQ